MKLRDVVPGALLVLLIGAGTLKSLPALAGLPFDLTAGIAGALGVATCFAWFGGLFRFPPGTVAWLVLVLTFLLPGALAVSGTYAELKVLGIFALTLPAMLAASFLMRRPGRVHGLLWASVGLGVVLAVLVFLGATATDVTTVDAAGTIAVARLTGAGLMALTVLTVTRQVRLTIAIPVGLLIMTPMIATGSRGPVLAVVLTGGLLLLLNRGRGLAATSFVLAALGFAGWWTYDHASPAARERFGLLFQADRGSSVNVRIDLLHQAWAIAQEQLLGIGWGGLAHHLYPLAPYPHNIVLEVAAEGGWIALATLVVVWLVAASRAYQLRSDPAALGALALLVYWTLNAMVSGDLNDNRGVFVLIGVCLALKLRERPDGRAVDADEETRRGRPHVAVNR